MYVERASRLPHVVAWEHTVGPGGSTARILPDGCLDLIWHDGEVFVAGPDTTTQLSISAPGSRFAALRFSAGTGPAVLGVPADELTDREAPLADLWPQAVVRPIAEAADPMTALERAALSRWQPADPLLVAVTAAARAGDPVGAIAGHCGLSARHLQRRCKTAFGYGPRTLIRILRFRRAVALARSGRRFADVAADTGYADQAHLSRDVRELAGVPLTALIT